MDRSFITAVVVALISGLAVAIWTQWRQDSRHQDLRKDKQLDQKRVAYEESIQHQREAVADFVRAVRELENDRLADWLAEVAHFRKGDKVTVENGVKNFKLLQDVEKELDILELRLLNPVVRQHIDPLREILKEVKKENHKRFEGISAEEGIEPPQALGKKFFDVVHPLIESARNELNVFPKPPFTPMVT